MWQLRVVDESSEMSLRELMEISWGKVAGQCDEDGNGTGNNSSNSTISTSSNSNSLMFSGSGDYTSVSSFGVIKDGSRDEIVPPGPEEPSGGPSARALPQYCPPHQEQLAAMLDLNSLLTMGPLPRPELPLAKTNTALCTYYHRLYMFHFQSQARLRLQRARIGVETSCCRK